MSIEEKPVGPFKCRMATEFEVNAYLAGQASIQAKPDPYAGLKVVATAFYGGRVYEVMAPDYGPETVCGIEELAKGIAAGSFVVNAMFRVREVASPMEAVCRGDRKPFYPKSGMTKLEQTPEQAQAMERLFRESTTPATQKAIADMLRNELGPRIAEVLQVTDPCPGAPHPIQVPAGD